MKNLLYSLSGPQRSLVLLILVAVCGFLLLAFTRDSYVFTAIFALFVFGLAYVTRWIWRPPEFGKNLVRTFSLTVVFLVSTSYIVWWQPLANFVFNSSLASYFGLDPTVLNGLPQSAPAVLVMIFVLSGVFIVNYFIRDRTGMREHSSSFGGGISEREFRRKLVGASRVLQNDLNRLDRETSWSGEYFEPLDAKVEVKKAARTKRKIAKLLNVIRNDQTTRVFLVLGDPGSGKSVALRTLAHQLLSEVQATGRLPVYVNLKEWRSETPWSPDNPPHARDLDHFLLKTLRERGDVFVYDFLGSEFSGKTVFRHMLEEGRFFLIFDSFDEIPQVLDQDEASWLIDQLSSVIYNFIAGGNETRGVVASRVFRRPTENLDAKMVLEIRPFSDKQILKSLEKSSKYSGRAITEILKARPDLVTSMRSPFSVGLVSFYSNSFPFTIPKSHSELYDAYIRHRIAQCHARLRELNIKYQARLVEADIFEFAKDLAVVLFENFGLEAPVEDLKDRYSKFGEDDSTFEVLVHLLEWARIIRIGSGPERRLSFVHRRFTEYFVATSLDDLDEALLEAIPSDNRWREPLAFKCEVADSPTAMKVARYCWQQMAALKTSVPSAPDFLRAVHSLRFVVSSFRTRPECLSSIQFDLCELVRQLIEERNSILTTKVAVEAIGSIKEENRDDLLIQALRVDVPWISDTALHSCRHLARLSTELTQEVWTYLSGLTVWETIARRSELSFSLSLSEAYSQIRRLWRAKVIDSYFFIAGSVLTFIAAPIPVAVVLAGSVIGVLLFTPVLSDAGLKEYLLRLLSKSGTKSADRNAPNNRLKKEAEVRFFHRSAPIHMWELFMRLTLTLILAALWLPEFRMLSPSLIVLSSGVYGAISLSGFLLLIPYAKALELVLLEDREKILRAIATLGGYAMGMSLAVFAIVWLAEVVPEWIQTIGSYVALTVGALFVLVVFGITVRSIATARIQSWRDKRVFHEMVRQTEWTRPEIQDCLQKLESEKFRSKFVQFLANLHRKPTGSWPSAAILRPGQGDSSMELSMLEEKWLGLDR